MKSVSTPPPPPGDDLEATVAMPRVTPPPPPPQPGARRIEPAYVAPSEPVRVSPAAPAGPPVTGTVIPPARGAPPRPVIAERPRYTFGHPVSYVFARFFAFALDAVLVTVVATSLLYSMIAVNPLTGLPTNTQSGFDATLAFGSAIAFVLILVAEGLFGTTIGKLAFGLQAYAVRGGAVGFGRAFVRMLLRPVDLLAIGGILALLPGHRRLGDLLGGTVVARSRMGAFAPVIGWVLALIVAGVPLLLTGVTKTFLSLAAFAEFFPGIVSRIVVFVQSLPGIAH